MNFSITILIAAIFVGVVKGGLGPVPGALIVPLLSTTMPVSDAVGITLPLLIVGDWIALPIYWRTWDSRALRLLLPGAVIGVIMGIVLLTSLPDDTLRRVLGVFTLIVAAYKLASDSLSAMSYTPRGWHGVLAGWGSGFGSALANAGAPPITAYLLLRRVTPTTLSAQPAFFLVVNLPAPDFSWRQTCSVAPDHRMPGAAADPAGCGAAGGSSRIDPAGFERLMLVLLAGVGLFLLLG
jgi:uncharacterized membrane protein YfcA